MKIEIGAAHYTQLDSNWNTDAFMPWSRIIPWSRIYFPVKGGGVVKTPEKEYILTPGKVVLIPAFAAIHISCPDYLEKYWCHFNIYFNNAQDDFFTFFHDPLEYTLKDDEFDYYSLIFKRLVAAYNVNNKTSRTGWEQLMAQSALSLLLEPFLFKVTGDCQRQEFPLIVKIISIMQREKYARLSMEDLGKMAGLHPNYLSRIFREKMGRSPMEYMKTMRMYRACQLLVNSSKSISEIAEEGGYENVASFSKAFRQCYGISPRTYRLELKNKRQ